ncbi:hypothetical protein AFLA_008638 [Aspergillus flavus NRRL3357]|nr:hypothetical protein AFLA_008638 [Aspergillus flavus NRRL3357]
MFHLAASSEICPICPSSHGYELSSDDSCLRPVPLSIPPQSTRSHRLFLVLAVSSSPERLGLSSLTGPNVLGTLYDKRPSAPLYMGIAYDNITARVTFDCLNAIGLRWRLHAGFWSQEQRSAYGKPGDDQQRCGLLVS